MSDWSWRTMAGLTGVPSGHVPGEAKSVSQKRSRRAQPAVVSTTR